MSGSQDDEYDETMSQLDTSFIDMVTCLVLDDLSEKNEELSFDSLSKLHNIVSQKTPPNHCDTKDTYSVCSSLTAATSIHGIEVVTQDFKSRIGLIIQGAKVVPTEYLFYNTQSLGGGFKCSLTLPTILPGDSFSGALSGNKKQAEQTAAKALSDNEVAMRTVRQWVENRKTGAVSLPSSQVKTGQSISSTGDSSNRDCKSELGLLVQSAKVVPTEYLFYSTVGVQGGFQCTLTLPAILPGEAFTGAVCGNKKQAEQSAARLVCIDESKLQRVQKWASGGGSAASVSGSAPSAADDQSVESVPTVNYKGQLGELLQLKGLSVASHTDIAFSEEAGHFQCRLKLLVPPLEGREFVGTKQRVKKNAEQAAFGRFMLDTEARATLDQWSQQKAIGSNSGAVMSSSHGQSVMVNRDCKSELGLLVQSAKVVPTEYLFYSTVGVPGGFQCTLTLPAILPGEAFTGAVCGNKKQAEQSAARLVCDDAEAVACVKKWVAGGVAAPRSVSTTSHVSRPLAEVTAVVPGPVPTVNYKGQLGELLQLKGLSVASHTDIAFSEEAGHFQCRLKLLVPPLEGREFVGTKQRVKKNAEQAAFGRFMLDIEARALFDAWQACDKVDVKGPSTAVSEGGDSSGTGRDCKSELGLLVQSAKVVPTEYLFYSTVGVPGGFQCTLTLPAILPGEAFTGAVCGNKKQAEQSAARLVCDDSGAVLRVREWIDSCKTVVDGDRGSSLRNALHAIFTTKGAVHSELCVFKYTAVDTKFSCQLRIPAVLGERVFTSSELGASKRDAEELAVKALFDDYLAMRLLDSWLPEVKKFAEPVNNILCANNRCPLGDSQLFCFFHASSHETHFTVKEEHQRRVLGVKGREGDNHDKESQVRSEPSVILYSTDSAHGQSYVAHCAKCRCVLGSFIACGEESLTSFDIDKMATEHGPFPFATWKRTSQVFADHFESRYCESFDSASVKYEQPLVVNVDRNDHAQFEWGDLLRDRGHGLKPYDYQLEAYRMSLLQNLIVVIPTGAGKTLIAALTMCRMKKLNPSRQVVMVVERVPLVEQQARAVEAYTGLYMLGVSGATKTKASIRNLRNGNYDGLVITAGLLQDLIRQSMLSVEDFSLLVLDECHHVTGEHDYTNILGIVKRLSEEKRPKLLGLSASPVQAKDVKQVQEKFAEMQRDFLGAALFRPSIHEDFSQKVGEEFLSQEPTSAQAAKQRSLGDELSKLMGQVTAARIASGDSDNADFDFSAQNCSTRKGWNDAVQYTFADTASLSDELLIAVKACVAQLDVNYLLGPRMLSEVMVRGVRAEIVSEIIRDAYTGSTVGDSSSDSTREHLTPAEFEGFLQQCSRQLMVLCTRLRDCSAENKILVFVETRHVAKILSNLLDALLPHFNTQKLIGNANTDGMSWSGKGGQKEVLDSFVRSECRLIVCTSVLEEGLDVKDCDLVFRFGGRPTLIQLVQSRGRARAKKSQDGGKLVVIFSAEESAHFDRIRKQEKVVDCALANRSTRFSDLMLLTDHEDTVRQCSQYDQRIL